MAPLCCRALSVGFGAATGTVNVELTTNPLAMRTSVISNTSPVATGLPQADSPTLALVVRTAIGCSVYGIGHLRDSRIRPIAPRAIAS